MVVALFSTTRLGFAQTEGTNWIKCATSCSAHLNRFRSLELFFRKSCNRSFLVLLSWRVLHSEGAFYWWDRATALLSVRAAYANRRSGGPFFDRSRLFRISYSNVARRTSCRRLDESWRTRSFATEIVVDASSDDNLLLSPALSLVNGVNYEGQELLVPDRTIAAKRSLF